jgi:heat-inducible transcriptional repressor
MSKKERVQQVLLGLVDYYIKTGKPVGSNTLKEAGFENLSAATIRNYFAYLDEQGLLLQQHASGGRIPTHMALRIYADYVKEQLLASDTPHQRVSLDFEIDNSNDTRAIATFLQHATEALSQATGCATFLSTPRFDQDFVVDIKFIGIDRYRCLCAIITELGTIQTEVLAIPYPCTSFALKRIENYCNAKLHQLPLPHLAVREQALAEDCYKEIMVRYLIGYVNFSQEQAYTTGLSRLLSHPEFQDAKIMAGSLSLFENMQGLRQLLQASSQNTAISCWIGDDLMRFGCQKAHCAVLAIPYRLNNQVVGALGLLGPPRLPYREHMLTLQQYANTISQTLTQAIYKYKITYRQPKHSALQLAGSTTPLALQLLEEHKQQPIQRQRKGHTSSTDHKEKSAHGR